MRTILALLVALGFTALLLAKPVREPRPEVNSGDWPMLGGGPSRNPANLVEKNVPLEWDIETKKNIKWVAELGSTAYGGPVVADGRIFVGTNNQNPRDPNLIQANARRLPIDLGVLMCFRESDGAFLWQAAHAKLKTGRVNDWPLAGICSTPTVEGKFVYYVSNRCEVVCADVASGKAIWTLDMIDKLNVFPHNMSSSSPLIVGDLLYVVTGNGVDEGHIHLPSPHAPSFVAINKKTGMLAWSDNSPGANIMHAQWSSPAYGVVRGQPQVVFPGGDGWIYSFDPAGKRLWKFDCNPKDAVYDLAFRSTRNHFTATPVVYNGRVYIGVGDDPEHETGVGHLWCIDMTKRGDVSPDLITDNTVFPPKTKKNPNSAAVWHYGGAITDRAEQRRLGRRNYFGRTMSNVVVHDGLVYASELLGWLHCLDADTGNVHWTHNLEVPIWSSPSYVDGKIYLGDDAGELHIFAHGAQKKLLAKIDMDGRIRKNAVAANGVLYVMTENRLFAIAAKR